MSRISTVARGGAAYETRGAIVNTGSVTGLMGNKDLLDYSTAKGGIHAFTWSLATHPNPRGIRVNAGAAGPVWTPLNPADKQEDEAKIVGKRHPFGQNGSQFEA